MHRGQGLYPWPAVKAYFSSPAGRSPHAEGQTTNASPDPFGSRALHVAEGARYRRPVHPMTPAGGQGANASIWDALALADVADAALRAGDVSRERLLPYERLRRPSNERSVAISRIARRAFRAGRYLPLAFVVPSVMRTINALGWPKRRIIRAFASAFVTGESRPSP